jgi:hypothetical protein
LSVVDIWHEPLAPYHGELHANVLARYYLQLLGLKRVTPIEYRFRDRLVNRLLRFKPLRNVFAARAKAHFQRAHVGHTVVLVAMREGARLSVKKPGGSPDLSPR